MMTGKIDRSQRRFDAIHFSHFSESSSTQHGVREREQFLHGRMTNLRRPMSSRNLDARCLELRLGVLRGGMVGDEKKTWDVE